MSQPQPPDVSGGDGRDRELQAQPGAVRTELQSSAGSRGRELLCLPSPPSSEPGGDLPGETPPALQQPNTPSQLAMCPLSLYKIYDSVIYTCK